MQRLGRLAQVCLCILIAGCASLASDNDTTTRFETIPQPARCELHGQGFFRAVNTPDGVRLPANAAPITLVCSADGYLTATRNIDTEADGWIFGNVLLGGPIGILIDGARGAGQKYAGRISLELQPDSFMSAGARDAWFARRRNAIAARWAAAIDAARLSCSNQATDPDSACTDEAERLAARRDAMLAELEARRAGARVTRLER